MNLGHRVPGQLLSLLTLSLFLASCYGTQSKPNVIIILTDDLGWADVGYQGGRDILTPNLDHLAEEGVTFSGGYVSAPYCSPSRAGLMTGRYQQRFGHEHNPDYDPDNPNLGTPLSETFLPEVLRANGYATCGIGKWHLGDHQKFDPRRRGFDHWFGFSGGAFSYYGTPNKRFRKSFRDQHGIFRNGKRVPQEEIAHLTDDFTAEAVAYIAKTAGQPFFMYLAYNAPHTPDHATAEHLKRSQHIEYGHRSVYAAMVAAVDAGIGQILQELKRQGLYERTIVIFLSDNGGRKNVSDNLPYRGHKGQLFEGGIRVPFLISWPGRLSPRKIQDPVISLDLFPTICSMTGSPIPDEIKLDGIDLSDALLSEEALPQRAFFWRVVGGDEWAVRKDKYKLIYSKYRNRRYLFNLAEDPRERSNLIGKRESISRELESEFREWNTQLVAPLWSDAHTKHQIEDYRDLQETRRKALPRVNN